jgi:hypothetical protein
VKLNSTLKFKCPECDKTCSQKLLFSDSGIEHWRCFECDKVGVFEADEKEEGGKKQKRSSIDCAALLERRGSSPSKPYSTKESYTDGDYLSHPKFGDGYVLIVVSPNKIEVLFLDGKKLLICGPGSKSAVQKIAEQKTGSQKSKKSDNRTNTTKEKSTKKAATSSEDGAMECPKCGLTVNVYNLSKNPKGKVVGCMHCSGR